MVLGIGSLCVDVYKTIIDQRRMSVCLCTFRILSFVFVVVAVHVGCHLHTPAILCDSILNSSCMHGHIVCSLASFSHHHHRKSLTWPTSNKSGTRLCIVVSVARHMRRASTNMSGFRSCTNLARPRFGRLCCSFRRIVHLMPRSDYLCNTLILKRKRCTVHQTVKIPSFSQRG